MAGPGETPSKQPTVAEQLIDKAEKGEEIFLDSAQLKELAKDQEKQNVLKDASTKLKHEQLLRLSAQIQQNRERAREMDSSGTIDDKELESIADLENSLNQKAEEEQKKQTPEIPAQQVDLSKVDAVSDIKQEKPYEQKTWREKIASFFSRETLLKIGALFKEGWAAVKEWFPILMGSDEKAAKEQEKKFSVIKGLYDKVFGSLTLRAELGQYCEDQKLGIVIVEGTKDDRAYRTLVEEHLAYVAAKKKVKATEVTEQMLIDNPLVEYVAETKLKPYIGRGYVPTYDKEKQEAYVTLSAILDGKKAKIVDKPKVVPAGQAPAEKKE